MTDREIKEIKLCGVKDTIRCNPLGKERRKGGGIWLVVGVGRGELGTGVRKWKCRSPDMG